jgi:hypothetical protein
MTAPTDQRMTDEDVGDDVTPTRDPAARRREFFAGAAVSGLGLVWAASRYGWVDPARAAAVAGQAGASCTLSRERRRARRRHPRSRHS